jgi:hypothetical protein
MLFLPGTIFGSTFTIRLPATKNKTDRTDKNTRKMRPERTPSLCACRQTKFKIRQCKNKQSYRDGKAHDKVARHPANGRAGDVLNAREAHFVVNIDLRARIFCLYINSTSIQVNVDFRARILRLESTLHRY